MLTSVGCLDLGDPSNSGGVEVPGGTLCLKSEASICKGLENTRVIHLFSLALLLDVCAKHSFVLHALSPHSLSPKLPPASEWHNRHKGRVCSCQTHARRFIIGTFFFCTPSAARGLAFD